MTPATATLARAARRLSDHLAELEASLTATNAVAWADYRETAAALAAVVAQLAPGNHGELLTTAQMAERLGVAPKTLLKRKTRGELRPAIARGKFIRWRGDEGAALTGSRSRVTYR